MEIVHDYEKIPLTSAEIGYLWNTYILNGKAKCMTLYAENYADDPNMKEIFKTAREMSDRYLNGVAEIFETVGHPIPYGFSEHDLKLGGEKLFSDKLQLHILKLLLTFGLAQYGVAHGLVARLDVRRFFRGIMDESLDLLDNINEVSLSKGIFMRTPNIPTPNGVEFADDKGVFGRFFGHKRPMTALEAASMFNTSLSNYIAKANVMGLAQTMKDDTIRDYFEKVVHSLKEHTEDLNQKLQVENLLVPSNLNSEILASTDCPYSDKLALFCTIAVLADLLGSYSSSKISILRKDLMVSLTNLSAEVALLSKEGIEIMIKKGWFEVMPKNVDRFAIIDSNEENRL